jgi:putative colanic acid biosysnthesis UDP-glucose lipid carrier transferase
MRDMIINDYQPHLKVTGGYLVIGKNDYVRSRKSFFLLKRIIDIVISVLIIVFILSWLVPVVGLIIILDSRGPVFFSQARVGRFGKSFRCLKFRTMYVNIEADFKQAEENDPRITRVGSFLRRTNLDEFPQFINVLLGQMSIVGPRPHMYKDCRDFSKVVKEYKFRSLVKPGITGLAQVKGLRGPTENEKSIVERYKWDAFYVKNAGSLMDLRVIAFTAKQTLKQGLKIFTAIQSLFQSEKSSKVTKSSAKSKQMAA